jgi:surfeit locus 1 family protein
VNVRSSDAPVDYALLADTPIEEIQYRRVLVQGEFLHDQERLLYTGPRVLHGKKGYNLLTPMRLVNGDMILVDRGWVPSEMKEKASRPETLSGGEVTLLGMVHRGEVQRRFVPDNDEKNKLWFWIDAMGALQQQGRNLYVRLLQDSSRSGYPIGGDAFIKHRNDHLQYAITWYSLAISVLVIYVLYHLKAARKTRAKG